MVLMGQTCPKIHRKVYVLLHRYLEHGTQLQPQVVLPSRQYYTYRKRDTSLSIIDPSGSLVFRLPPYQLFIRIPLNCSTSLFSTKTSCSSVKSQFVVFPHVFPPCLGKTPDFPHAWSSSGDHTRGVVGNMLAMLMFGASPAKGVGH